MIEKGNRILRDTLFWLLVVSLGISSIKGVPLTLNPQGTVTGYVLIGGTIFVGCYNLYRFIKNKTNGNKPMAVKG